MLLFQYRSENLFVYKCFGASLEVLSWYINAQSMKKDFHDQLTGHFPNAYYKLQIFLSMKHLDQIAFVLQQKATLFSLDKTSQKCAN